MEVMDFSLPREGQKGTINLKTPDSSIYKVTDVVWTAKDGTSIAVWHSGTGYKAQNGVFEAGRDAKRFSRVYLQRPG